MDFSDFFKYNIFRYLRFEQVTFEDVMLINKVLTQGSPLTKEWVTKYKIQLSEDGVIFNYVQYGIEPEVCIMCIKE